MTDYLETNGARIAYDADGHGPAVLFVHAGVANRHMWDAQVAALRDAYRIIRHDTRGYGDTETADVEFSNRADIAALLDHLGEASAHLVGLSRGGQIALDFALESPDRVRSLTVAGGGIGGYEDPDEADPSIFEEPENAWKAKDWAAISEWETRYWVDGPGQPADRVDPQVRALVHGWILSNYRAEKVEGSPQPLDPPAGARLGELRVPLLVMNGTFDDPGTQGSMRHLRDAVPGARYVELASAHMMNLEQPEQFNRALREFLDEVSAR